MYHRTGELLVRSFEKDVPLLEQVVLITVYKRFHPYADQIGEDESTAGVYKELRLWAQSLEYLYSKEGVKQGMAKALRHRDRLYLSSASLLLDVIFRLYRLTELTEREFIQQLGRLARLDAFGGDEFAQVRDRLGDVRYKRMLKKGANQAYKAGEIKAADQLTQRRDELIAGKVVAE